MSASSLASLTQPLKAATCPPPLCRGRRRCRTSRRPRDRARAAWPARVLCRDIGNAISVHPFSDSSLVDSSCPPRPWTYVGQRPGVGMGGGGRHPVGRALEGRWKGVGSALEIRWQFNQGRGGCIIRTGGRLSRQLVYVTRDRHGATFSRRRESHDKCRS
jgi:hypothetical protein